MGCLNKRIGAGSLTFFFLSLWRFVVQLVSSEH